MAVMERRLAPRLRLRPAVAADVGDAVAAAVVVVVVQNHPRARPPSLPPSSAADVVAGVAGTTGRSPA